MDNSIVGMHMFSPALPAENPTDMELLGGGSPKFVTPEGKMAGAFVTVKTDRGDCATRVVVAFCTIWGGGILSMTGGAAITEVLVWENATVSGRPLFLSSGCPITF